MKTRSKAIRIALFILGIVLIAALVFSCMHVHFLEEEESCPICAAILIFRGVAGLVVLIAAVLICPLFSMLSSWRGVGFLPVVGRSPVALCVRIND